MPKRVRVYEDPITRQKLEGEALLVVEYGSPDRSGNVQCDVRFDGDGFLVSRRVHVSEIRPTSV